MERKTGMNVAWILNGCGLESGSITGSPIRFQAVSSRWQESVAGLTQVLVTTSGGERMLRKMGCAMPALRLPASLLLKEEPFKAFRFWSYAVTAFASRVSRGRLPQADVAITVSDYFCDTVPALLMKRRQPGLRWIAWIHHKERAPSERPGNRFVNEITWRMQAWSFRQIARHADQAWVLDSDAGDEIAACLRTQGMASERIRKMRNGIDLSVIQSVPNPNKQVDAVMIGVRPNKGAFDIVPIWKEVQRLRPGAALRLMGGMAGEGAVREQIAREGLDKVIEVFKPEGGWLQPADFFKKVKEARILFAPSHEEGWGIALCEAMACGLPVVAYDLPVYRRVYGDALATVAEGDYSGFAAKICTLLDDAEAYETFRKTGLDCAMKYGWTELAKQDWAALS
jgi:glycosyltransferase involved in cell wall biosynthesis